MRLLESSGFLRVDEPPATAGLPAAWERGDHWMEQRSRAAQEPAANCVLSSSAELGGDAITGEHPGVNEATRGEAGDLRPLARVGRHRDAHLLSSLLKSRCGPRKGTR